MVDILEERRRLAAVGLTMRYRHQWGAVFNYTTERDVTEPATLLVAHIAVVDDPGDLVGTEDQVMRTIERIGISRFPATGISYNAAAFNTGRLYEGQPLGRRGAHTVNARKRSTCTQSGCPSNGDSLVAPSWNNNINSRACVAPQQVDDTVTNAQVDAFAQWGAALKLAGFVTRDARWHGHRCFAAKDCPGGRMWARLDDIADLTATYVRAGLPGAHDEEDELPTPADMWDHDILNRVTGGKSDADDILSGTHKDTWDTKQAVDRLDDKVEALDAKIDQVLALLIPQPPEEPPA